ncbi:MAG: ATP-dependent DNA helicase, partial [Myxococcales bacterium]
AAEQAVRLQASMTRRLKGAADELNDALLAVKGHLSEAERTEAQAIGRRAGEIATDLEFLVDARDPSFVYWAEARMRTRTLRAAPIDVAETLRERLYRETDTVVFTSATLATQGRFDFVKQRLGMQDPHSGEDLLAVDELRVESPFDYREQSALYTPTHLPEPTAPEFVHAVAEEIFALTRITGGRAFALFTSLRNMTEAHRLLKDRLPYRVLLQGEKPKAALIAEFREKPSVLFAAHSFWEGVDIAGDALSLVIIDKLPFASPGDPVVSARIDLLKSRGLEPFGAYQVPVAAIALRQGFGRLIRTRRDRGVVAVLDRRLSTKGYGRAFLASLPPCPRATTIERVAQWWNGGRS